MFLFQGEFWAPGQGLHCLWMGSPQEQGQQCSWLAQEGESSIPDMVRKVRTRDLSDVTLSWSDYECPGGCHCSPWRHLCQNAQGLPLGQVTGDSVQCAPSPVRHIWSRGKKHKCGCTYKCTYKFGSTYEQSTWWWCNLFWFVVLKAERKIGLI